MEIGDWFIWLTNDTVKWEKVMPSCRLILVGIESLLAICKAIYESGLSLSNTDDIFYNNVVTLLDIKSPVNKKV